MSSYSRWKTPLTILGIALVAAGFAYHVSSHPMDFRVYHHGARGVFDGTRPVYGATSGLGWPMHYRYPPLFLLLFAPLAMLPLGPAAAVWVVAKIGTLGWLMVEAWRRGLQPAMTYWIVPILFIAPYIIEEFRYGNAQFFVVALAIAGLWTARSRPALAGAVLGLAISVKVWPLFFLPYLGVRRDWKPVAYTLGFVLVLAVLPSIYFGVQGNIDLLGQWFMQEYQTQLSESEIWFPNQSLRGVLMRYLTVVDYSQLPDSNYAQINLAALDPSAVRLLWMVLAGGLYAAFLFLANRRRHGNGWLDHALAFCLVALLQPFTQKYALAVLLAPVVVTSCLMKDRRVRILLYFATILVLIQPMAPGAGAQRLLQVLGLDFGATLLLTIAIALACLKFSDDSFGCYKIETRS